MDGFGAASSNASRLRREGDAQGDRRLAEDVPVRRRKLPALLSRAPTRRARNPARWRTSWSRTGWRGSARRSRRGSAGSVTGGNSRPAGARETRGGATSAAPQVGREGGGPYGCFDLWLRINGKDVANSNVQLCQDEGSRAKDVIVSQGIVPMKAGDRLEVMMSASNPAAKICIEAIRPKGEPLVPAIVFSTIE